MIQYTLSLLLPRTLLAVRGVVPARVFAWCAVVRCGAVWLGGGGRKGGADWCGAVRQVKGFLCAWFLLCWSLPSCCYWCDAGSKLELLTGDDLHVYICFDARHQTDDVWAQIGWRAARKDVTPEPNSASLPLTLSNGTKEFSDFLVETLFRFHVSPYRTVVWEAYLRAQDMLKMRPSPWGRRLESSILRSVTILTLDGAHCVPFEVHTVINPAEEGRGWIRAWIWHTVRGV